MSTLKFVVFLSLLTSCAETGKNDVRTTSDSSINIKADASASSRIQVDSSKLAAMQFAEGIISGQIHPSDNDQTFAWLDSLQSDSKRTRDVAFNVYRAMCLKSDGALSEAICGHVKSYFKVYPSDFLDNYTTLDEKQRLQTIENIAFEFYASGTDYKNDIADYFTAIKNKCEICYSNTSFKEIKSSIEKQVSKMDN